MTNLGVNSISSIIGFRRAPRPFTKFMALGSDWVYQRSTLTVFPLTGALNSMLILYYYTLTTFASCISFLSFYPSAFPIKMLGILIPSPVPSSDITTPAISSFLLSIMITSYAPLRAAFLTFVTKWQFPLSKRINLFLI